MSEISIQEIQSDRVNEYKAFIVQGFINEEEHFRITATDDLKTGFPTKDLSDSFTLAAFSNSCLVAVVSFARDGSDREKLRHKALLFRMYVSSEFRGMGIARKLIESVIARVVLLTDIEQINLTVIATNSNAKALYEKIGFKSYGFEPNAIKWKNKYFDEDLMVLDLKELREKMFK
jgi:ribosomal protein S18 acetylase RimI-like enzyme